MDREYVQPGVGCQLCVVRVTGKRQRRILATGNSDGVDGDRRGRGVAGPTDRRIERGRTRRSGFRPSFTILAGLAVIGAPAALGVGNASAVASASSSLDVGAAPAR